MTRFTFIDREKAHHAVAVLCRLRQQPQGLTPGPGISPVVRLGGDDAHADVASVVARLMRCPSGEVGYQTHRVDTARRPQSRR